MRTPDPDPKVEAWIKRQLANRPPLTPEQRHHIAQLLAHQRADRVNRQLQRNENQ